MSLLLLFRGQAVAPSAPTFSTQAEGDHTFLHFPTTSTQPINVSTLIDVNLGDNAEMEYYFEEIRRRQLSIVMLQGVDVLALRRLTFGTRCPFWKSEEEQCDRPLDSTAPCYNTGWIGGYTSPLAMKIVIPPENRTAVYYERGVRQEYQPRPWTIQEPILKDRDLIVMIYTGQRFEVMGIKKVIFRGLPMHQEFTMNILPIDSESYAIKLPLPSPLP